MENENNQKKLKIRLKKIKKTPKNDFISRMIENLLDQTINEEKSLNFELESNQKAKDLLNAYEFEVTHKIELSHEVFTTDGYNFPIPPSFENMFKGFSGF